MNLFEQFEVLEDLRDIRGKKYKLTDILIMTIYAILCGQEDYVNIAYFIKIKEEYFKALLALENGTPSHDCLSDVYAKIDSKKFMEVFIKWVEEMIKKKTGKKISIDGKAVRSATDKINGGNIPYIVSAFLGNIGLSIGQVKVEDVIRDHWNIECGLHWRLDVILNEDHSKNRKQESIHNLSILRKIVFNLASLDQNFGKVPLKRKLINYMLDFSKIERLIFDVIPNMNYCQ